MGFEIGLTAFTAVACLGLGVLAAVRGREDLLAPRLAVLTLDLFAYEVCELLALVSKLTYWNALSNVFGDLAVAAGVHFCVAFLGQERALRRELTLVWTFFGALALWLVVSPAASGSPSWALLTLGGMLPAFAWCAVKLTRYARESDGEEKARAQLTLSALALGVGGAATDLASLASGGGVKLANFGILGSVLMLGAVALRIKTLRGVTATAWLTVLSLAAGSVLAQVAVFYAFGRWPAVLFLGTLLVVFVMLAAVRQVTASYTKYLERLEYHAHFGDFTSQLAHDMRGPLGIVKNQAENLLFDLERQRPIQRRDLELVVEQSNRILEKIAEYQRMSRVEVRLEGTDATELTTRTVEGMRRAFPEVKLEARTNGAVACTLDVDLVQRVLENLVRNAVEAPRAAGSGALTITINVSGAQDRVRFVVEDDGPGMDARTLEQVKAGKLFTTKANGSGLGLTLARRVAVEHGGTLGIESAPGKGTRVTLDLPARQ